MIDYQIYIFFFLNISCRKWYQSDGIVDAILLKNDWDIFSPWSYKWKKGNLRCVLPSLQAQLCQITLHCQWAKNIHLQTISRACGDLKVSVKAYRDTSVFIWCIATKGCIFCIRQLQKFIMNDLPVIYLCHSCLYAFEVLPPFILAGSSNSFCPREAGTHPCRHRCSL